jgi:hypothetical protein
MKSWMSRDPTFRAGSYRLHWMTTERPFSSVATMSAARSPAPPTRRTFPVAEVAEEVGDGDFEGRRRENQKVMEVANSRRHWGPASPKAVEKPHHAEYSCSRIAVASF